MDKTLNIYIKNYKNLEIMHKKFKTLIFYKLIIKN